MEEQPVCIQNESACLAEAHDSSRVLDQETGVSEVSEYCKDLLMRGQEEMNFEELRAERYFELKKKKMQEKLQRLKEEEEQLRQELEKKRQQRLSVSQARNSCKPAASFHVYESAEENPSGKSEAASSHRPNDLIVKSDEKGLCLKVLFPGLPEGVVSSRGSQNSEPEQYGLQKLDLGKVGAKQMYRGDSKRSGPLTISKPQENLSPIEEISVESASLPSPEGCSPIERDHSTQPGTNSNRPFAAAVNPCDADVRRRLLENSDIFSSPNLHSQSGSLPAVTEHSCLHLGGAVFDIFSTLMDGDGFSVFQASTDNDFVLIKVDSCSTPWDFYQFGRLRSSSAGAGLPLISCFLFDDGCITVYTPPQDHTFTELMESVQDSSELVGCKAVGLLQLLLQLHSCRLLHAALRPNVLTCCHIGCQEPACIFPIDWSTSVDLDLQQNITSVQHLPSAQPYIHLGLLEPNDPPHLVDLVGVAETVHLLLTNSAMVLVKDASGWQVEQFSGDGPCDIDTTMWRRFFRSLLNAGRRSPTSILTELKEQLVSLYL
ncbi:uncharacterized protein LOC101160375 isoform X1 [Oryzias latipes]|uniref:Uncharacterized protein n=1 Tax=Oryzias latipes TaxID=8090 RepID=H2MM08_ORYLA|nr:uncharacterized protein LOC101160375 isoform X1 [Oryzias latipes]